MTTSPVESVVQRLRTWRSGGAIALFPVLVAFIVSTPTLAHAGVAPIPQINAMTQPYHSVTIGQPAANATVFDNAGNVEVRIITSPTLRAGDRIALNIDGRAMPPQNQGRIELSGLDRGEHTLKATIVDAGGYALMSSAAVTFYVWRGSLLFPARERHAVFFSSCSPIRILLSDRYM
jgi:hypothetical protein